MPKPLTPIKALKDTVQSLEKLDCQYCLIGGHAASLYRKTERFTKDVDFAVIAKPASKSREMAEECIKSMGLKFMAGFVPLGKNEKKRKSVCFVCSAPDGKELKGIIDILLPELPWVKNAIARAQDNLINLGFANVPVITPEDLIISKCYSYNNSPDRFQDLDDIKEILISGLEIDLNYIFTTLEKLELKVPKEVKKFF